MIGDLVVFAVGAGLLAAAGIAAGMLLGRRLEARLTAAAAADAAGGEGEGDAGRHVPGGEPEAPAQEEDS